jgi:metal-responsive CopG/Arc/MetJ family transcriptional regulator
MPRRKQTDDTRSVGFGITLDEDVAAQLDTIMDEDKEPKRSRAISALIAAEHKRRERKRHPSVSWGSVKFSRR